MKPGEMINICLSCCSFKPGYAVHCRNCRGSHKMDNYCSWAEFYRNFSVGTYHLVLGWWLHKCSIYDVVTLYIYILVSFMCIIIIKTIKNKTVYIYLFFSFSCLCRAEREKGSVSLSRKTFAFKTPLPMCSRVGLFSKLALLFPS